MQLQDDDRPDESVVAQQVATGPGRTQVAVGDSPVASVKGALLHRQLYGVLAQVAEPPDEPPVDPPAAEQLATTDNARTAT